VSAFDIRQAGVDDLDAVGELAARFYGEEGFDTAASVLRQHLNVLIDAATARVLIAKVDGLAAGFAVTTTTLGLEHSVVAELQDLYVLPEHRAHGVAAALVDESRRWAIAQGCEVLDVVVDREGDARHGLIAYYTRRGFRDQGRRLLSAPLRDQAG